MYSTFDPQAPDQTEKDEQKEVVTHLASLRKKHDSMKETNIRKRGEYERILKEIASIETEAQTVTDHHDALCTKIDSLERKLERSNTRHLEEAENRKTYDHVIDRLKKNKLKLELSANRDNSTLRQLESVVTIESNKERRIQEEKHTSRMLLAELKRNISLDHRRKSEVEGKYEKSIAMRQGATARRELRLRKQAEIIEQAAFEDVSSSEAKLKEQFSLHKFWLEFLRKRFTAEQHRSQVVEDVFQRIKIATGQNDVNEIVNTFLSREKMITSLMQEVTKQESRLDELKERHKFVKEKYSEVTIIVGMEDYRREIHTVSEQIVMSRKEMGKANQELEQYAMLYDKIVAWGLKMHNKLSENTTLPFAVPLASDLTLDQRTITDLFGELNSAMTQAVKGTSPIVEELEQVAAKQIHEITSEIESNEYISKNLRVNPKLLDSHDTLSRDETWEQPQISATISSAAELATQRKAMKEQARQTREAAKKAKRQQKLKEQAAAAAALGN